MNDKLTYMFKAAEKGVGNETTLFCPGLFNVLRLHNPDLRMGSLEITIQWHPVYGDAPKNTRAGYTTITRN